tara:strand:+ start:109 stop:297 length:189 start_codon:yes stop_codon:yes gene_type:complete
MKVFLRFILICLLLVIPGAFMFLAGLATLFFSEEDKIFSLGILIVGGFLYWIGDRKLREEPK